MTTTTEREHVNLQARSLVGALGFASLPPFAEPASRSAFAAAGPQTLPVIVESPAGGSVSSVNIANRDSRRIPVQVHLFRWSEADVDGTSTPTEDVVARPSFSVGTRVTLRGDCDAGTLRAVAPVSARR